MSATTTRKRPDGGALEAEELAAWRGFLRVHSALTRELDAELLSEHGFSLSSYEVLIFLADAPEAGMRMSELADSVLLSRSGLTRLVDRLERDGLVSRKPCASDLRGYNALITPRGRQKLRVARRTHLAGVRRLFLEHFTPSELGNLAELWERVKPGAAATADGDSC